MKNKLKEILMKNKLKIAVIIIGFLVVFFQFSEFLANQSLSNEEQKKDELYTDYVRYLDFQTQAQVLRGVYNTLQAINNSEMHTTLVDREEEMIDYVLTSLYALTNHINVDRSSWNSLGFYELMNKTVEMGEIVNDVYGQTIQNIKSLKSAVNTYSSLKYGVLAVEVIAVNADKWYKKAK